MAHIHYVYLVAGRCFIGGWCTDCLLESGIYWHIYRLADDGPVHHITIRRCYDCGRTIKGT